MKKLLILVALLVFPSVVFAAEKQFPPPRWSLELKGGFMFPAVPGWDNFYEDSYAPEVGGALAYKIVRNVEVGVGGSYIWTKGLGQAIQHGTASGNVTFELAPLDVFVVARGVFNEKQWVVPYAGGGYTRLFYREKAEGQGETKGSVNGYHLRGGLQFLLDAVDPDAARNGLHEYGLYHTYFFTEAKYLHANADTNPTGSVKIGGLSALGGLLFEF